MLKSVKLKLKSYLTTTSGCVTKPLQLICPGTKKLLRRTFNLYLRKRRVVKQLNLILHKSYFK
jgi:hypothetical protein